MTLEGTWEGALTAAQGGAPFRLEPAGKVLLVAWPHAHQRRVAWLVRDRNANGAIDDLSELYSSATPHFNQDPDGRMHGFTALASEDTNGDGAITEEDAHYADTSLWFDMNHDGRTDPREVRSLASLGVISMSLRYAAMNAKDGGGNTIIFESTGVQRMGRRLNAIRVYDALIKTAFVPESLALAH